MERKQCVGALGALLLAAGVFTPLVRIGLPFSLPLPGLSARFNFSYYAYSAIGGSSAWLILVGLAAAALVVALARVYLLLLFTGIVSLGLIALTAFDLYVYVAALLNKLPRLIPIRVGHIVQPTWGCVPLLLGPLLMLLAVCMRSEPRRTWII